VVYEHGSESRYRKGCRCLDCAEAGRMARRRQRAAARGLPVAASGGPVQSPPIPSINPGMVERATLKELETLSAAKERLSFRASAIRMCQILDDPRQYPTHVRAAKVLDDIMKRLRTLSNGGHRKGRLASVHPMLARQERGDE
jgi:hypothetical protein